MKIKVDNLGEHLRGGMCGVYLIYGDEPLQIVESADAIRKHAKQNGYTERTVIDADSGYDWKNLYLESHAMSLFDDRKVIDVRLPSGKPGNDGSAQIVEYCENPQANTILMITCEKLESGSVNSKWFKAIDKVGAVIQSWNIDRAYLPSWISRRARSRGVKMTQDAAALLAELSEGNLLACAQEIRKLAILHQNKEISVSDVENAVIDTSKHTVYSFMDDVLSGDVSRLTKSLFRLKDEGVEPIIVNWAIKKDIKALFDILSSTLRGEPESSAFRRNQVWSRREPIVRSALKRVTQDGLLYMLQHAYAIDDIVKGRRQGDEWDELLTLGCRMSGHLI